MLMMVSSVGGFSIGGSHKKMVSLRPFEPVHPYSTSGQKLQFSSGSEEKEGILSNFNPLYGGLWAAFLTFGLFLSPGSIGDPADTAIIQAYIDNPTAPEGINPVFLIIFNGLGVMPLVLSQLACPQGSPRGPPAGPFFAAAFGMGYGAAGLYLAVRAPPVVRKLRDETSWFTRTVLENKLTSIAALGLLVSVVLQASGSSHVVDEGWVAAAADYVALAEQSKLVCVSSLDLVILTIAAATLIPRDLQLRQGTNNDDPTDLGRTIAIATVFFPILGAALYCLWRPSLPEE